MFLLHVSNESDRGCVLWGTRQTEMTFVDHARSSIGRYRPVNNGLSSSVCCNKVKVRSIPLGCVIEHAKALCRADTTDIETSLQYHK